MEDAKKKERENRKGGGGNAAGHGMRGGQSTSIGCVACDGEMLGLAVSVVGQQWMGRMGMDEDGYPGGSSSSCLFSPLECFSPLQKEKKKYSVTCWGCQGKVEGPPLIPD